MASFSLKRSPSSGFSLTALAFAAIRSGLHNLQSSSSSIRSFGQSNQTSRIQCIRMNLYISSVLTAAVNLMESFAVCYNQSSRIILQYLDHELNGSKALFLSLSKRNLVPDRSQVLLIAIALKTYTLPFCLPLVQTPSTSLYFTLRS